MIAASERTQSSLDLYVKSCTDLTSLNPFEIHVLVLDSALANWRSYIIALTERITHQVRRAVCYRLELLLLTSCSQTKSLLPLSMGRIHPSFLMYSSIPSYSAPFFHGVRFAQKLIIGQVEERQNLKELEDQILDVILVLDSTSDTILSLIENYRQFRQDLSVREEANDGGYDAIDVAFQEKLRDVSFNRMKVQTLNAKLKSTIELVS